MMHDPRPLGPLDDHRFVVAGPRVWSCRAKTSALLSAETLAVPRAGIESNVCMTRPVACYQLRATMRDM